LIQLSARIVVIVTTPVAGPAVPAQPLMAHLRGLAAVLAIPAVIDHQHPPPCGAGATVRCCGPWQPARLRVSGSHKVWDFGTGARARMHG
jgi:hypothetical protein